MTEPPGDRAPEPSSRRILFLDDDPRRAEAFLIHRPRAVWVTTAADCVARLAEAWDEVHLDHDLGGERFVDASRDDCGMAVVRWLCERERAHLREARFFVHSHNLNAASQMVGRLTRDGYVAEYRPFGHDLMDFLAVADPAPAPPRRPGVRGLVARLLGKFLDRGRRLPGSRPTRYDEDRPRERAPGTDAGIGSEEGS